MPWRGKKDVERHNKKCSQYEACRKIWLKTANDYYKKTGDDGQAVIRANVAAKKWLLSHGKYRRNSDVDIQRLRRAYAQDPSFDSAMALAGALLRTASLGHFRQLTMAGEPEALALIRYMRTQLLGENAFHEIENDPTNPRFMADTATTPYPYITKYVNIYCDQTPYASITVSLVDDAINVVQTLRNFYTTAELLPPPDPVEISSRVSRILGKDKVVVVGVYDKQPGKIIVTLENAACFAFVDEDAIPIEKHEKHASRKIQIRELAEEDFTSDEQDTGYRRIEYEDLPDFAKPSNQVGIPTYLVANLVTRGQVRDIDGPAWQNFFEPVAKVYVGYLINYLITQPSGWAWNDATYTYTCHNTEEAAQAFIDTLDVEEGITLVGLPGRLLRRLDLCPLAGIQQFVNEKPSRSRCQECGIDVDIELYQSRQLQLAEDALAGTPEPPAHVNHILDLLQRLYQHEVYGDINSVLGGQDLSVSLSAGCYGPLVD